MKIPSLLKFLLALAISSLAVLSGQFHSRVQILVDDGLGNAVPAESITISHAGTTNNVGEQPLVLEYGTYEIKVMVRGFAETRVSITIDQPSQIVRVAMKLGAPEGMPDVPVCSIVGFAPPGLNAVSVRAIELFGSYLTDVPLNSDHKFEIRNLSCEYYLIIAMGSSKVLGTMIVGAAMLPERVELKASSIKRRRISYR
jgi:hypothetical protein